MILSELFKGIYPSEIPEPFRHYKVFSVESDSRKVVPGSLFVALKGAQTDGKLFLQDALGRGASIIVSQGNNFSISGYPDHPSVCFVQVPDAMAFFTTVAQRFFGYPANELSLLGVTGTNGKTTATYLLESLIKAAGQSCGVIGTINYRYAGVQEPSHNTTLGFLDNQKFFAKLVAHNIPYCVMEVSSHGLAQGRVKGLNFHVAIFTNLTGDHLDYHKTMEEYFQAKALLFTQLSPQAYAVINADDPFGQRLTVMTSAKRITYGIHRRADVTAESLELDAPQTRFAVRLRDRIIPFETNLIGIHNVYNILACVAAGVAMDIPMQTIQKAIATFQAVPGRLERIANKSGIHVFVDYAHTDDALMNVLGCLKKVSKRKLIAVFGCGGDRDRTKRPRMGKVAAEWADFTIITNDNPRSEEPSTIAEEIAAGFTHDRYKVILDRQQAIETAIHIAQKDDIILIAGKGHETYQIYKDRTVEFDDREVARTCLRKREG